MSNDTHDAAETAQDDVAETGDGYALRVRVLNEQGLHARPAARLAQEAQKFACDISLALGEERVDAKSILDILTLAAGHGSELELRAAGPDARDALARLGSLIRNRFR
ncbi:HPr family phosphocarrier protein [Solidesulfovibrio sp.]|uniref:HPr family phosphocarrier protein n=1 Tax=Solidesulfovibrio sp. TaxID=2910990 RepID=UPI002B1FA00E|nr:HPr family phosphocarrier protein [Solidesulfovibrio sp.]MEA5088681.1 HPr family phosphocarrier protein [Solidesulfovibrio sp.]